MAEKKAPAEQKIPSVDVFSLVRDCFLKKKHPAGVLKREWNKYLAHRLLMDVEELVFLANELNVHDVPAATEFALLQAILPKISRAPRLTLAKDRDKTDPVVKEIMRFYMCDEPTAIRYKKFADRNPKILEEIRFYADTTGQ